MSESIELYESMNREIQQLDEQIASLEESLRDFKLRRAMFAQAVEHFQNNQQMPHPMAPS
jgi:exonuclease VII small subunit